MTFDEENVTDVVLDVSGETPGYGQDAGDALREALLTAQSTEIDGVSGSTITSQAVIVAAGKCFAQARGEAVVDIITVDKGSADDWLGTEPNIDDASIAETWDTDILIVGAGNGGMCAAAYAAQKGLKFRVIEQNPVVQDTRHWYGAIDSSESKKAGVTVNRKKLLAEISRYASGKCDQRVVATWINESAAMHDFVAGKVTRTITPVSLPPVRRPAGPTARTARITCSRNRSTPTTAPKSPATKCSSST